MPVVRSTIRVLDPADHRSSGAAPERRPEHRRQRGGRVPPVQRRSGSHRSGGVVRRMPAAARLDAPGRASGHAAARAGRRTRRPRRTPPSQRLPGGPTSPNRAARGVMIPSDSPTSKRHCDVLRSGAGPRQGTGSGNRTHHRGIGRTVARVAELGVTAGWAPDPEHAGGARTRGRTEARAAPQHAVDATAGKVPTTPRA